MKRKKMNVVNGKRVAYAASDNKDGWGVSICMEGVKGHIPLDDYAGPYTVERAEEIAERMNERLQIPREEVVKIVLSTMPSFGGARKPRRDKAVP